MFRKQAINVCVSKIRFDLPLSSHMWLLAGGFILSPQGRLYKAAHHTAPPRERGIQEKGSEWPRQKPQCLLWPDCRRNIPPHCCVLLVTQTSPWGRLHSVYLIDKGCIYKRKGSLGASMEAGHQISQELKTVRKPNKHLFNWTDPADGWQFNKDITVQVFGRCCIENPSSVVKLPHTWVEFSDHALWQLRYWEGGKYDCVELKYWVYIPGYSVWL